MLFVYSLASIFGEQLTILFNMTNINEKIYTVASACDLLEITPNTLRKELRKGKIKGYKKLNKWYILHNNLLEYIKSE